VKTRTARQSNRRLIEGCSTFLSHCYLIFRFHEVRVRVPDAMSDKAGMLSRLISGCALVPKEVSGRDLPDQVEIISLHALQTPAILQSSWIPLGVVLRLSSSRVNPRRQVTGSWEGLWQARARPALIDSHILSLGTCWLDAPCVRQIFCACASQSRFREWQFLSLRRAP
jgi:hypothetical protein